MLARCENGNILSQETAFDVAKNINIHKACEAYQKPVTAEKKRALIWNSNSFLVSVR